MQTEYDYVSGHMPAATVVSVALHAFIAILISSSVLSSVATYRSNAVTVALTPSKQAPSDATHMASQQQVASVGDGQRSLTDPSPSTTLAILKAFFDQVANPSDLAAEAEKLQGELTKMQETQAQNTRLGSVAARRALDADYLKRWIRRVENFGNAALANVGSSRGDVRLLVVVNKLGILLDVRLLESSGFPHLDRAAIKTVQDSSPYPAFPPALGSQVDKL